MRPLGRAANLISDECGTAPSPMRRAAMHAIENIFYSVDGKKPTDGALRGRSKTGTEKGESA
ncbi:hypothetical protein [Reyranella sp.]|uniref:hypothetical protein n=1 Tax=Reyranella sp. TaxID=1929291 RepID=UPI003D10834A